MRRTIPLMIAVSLIAVTAPAQAFYVGGGYLSIDSEFGDAVDAFDTDDSAYKLYIGFDAFRFLDFEGTYRDLGDHAGLTGPDTLAMNLEAWDVAARGIVPVGRRLSLFARAGYANVNREGTLNKGGVVQDLDEDAWELTWGGGIEIEFGRHFGLRAEWEEYDIHESLSSFSAGAWIRF